MTPGALLLVALAGMASGLLAAFRAPRLWLLATLAGKVAALIAAVWILATGATWDWQPDFMLGGERLHWRLDGVSAFFLVLLCVLGGAGSLYSREYWSDKSHPVSAPVGRAWWNGLLLGMAFVLLSANGLHFLIAWEIFTVCAYFLITLDRQKREVRKAGWLYLAASHFGTLCLFAFFALLAARTGSWELGPLRDHPELAPLFWLALVGFGVKSAIFPLHIWLPSAHANAPSHVSAIFSGVTIKMGIYGIVRFSGWLPTPAAAGWTVAALGVVSAVLGVAFALGQHDLKRLLAYHSVENIGIILIGLGFAMIATDPRPSGLGTTRVGGRVAARLESRLVQGAVVSWRRFGVARHRHARNEPAGRALARDAVDGGIVRAGRDGHCRSAAAQRLRQRMAGVSGFVRRGVGAWRGRRGPRCRRRCCWG